MPDLNVVIGADTSQYNAAMQSVGSTASSTSNAIVGAFDNQQKSIQQLTIKMASYQQVVNKATNPAIIIEYNQKIEELNTEISRLSNLGKKGFESLSNGAMSASMKLAQMRSGMSAARDGVMAFTVGGQAGERMLMAMGHHITSLVNETGSLKGAFTALTGSLMGAGGIILAISLAAELWSKYSDSQKEAKKSTEEYKDTLDSVSRAGLQGKEDGNNELTRLKLLYDATQNHVLSLKARNQAYDELEAKYPKYFTNADREKTLLGENAIAYQNLAKSILAAANAKAYENQIGENSNKIFESQNQRYALEGQKGATQGAYNKKLAELRKSYPGLPDSELKTLYGPALIGQIEKVISLQRQINDLKKNEGQLTRDNSQLSKMALSNEIAAGFKTEGDFDDKAQKVKDQIEQIRAEIKRLQLDILAHPENKETDLLQIEKLKKQLADLNPSLQKAKDGLAALKAERDKLAAALQDGIISGKIKSTDFSNPILKQLEALDARILKVTADFNILMGLSPRPGREILPTNTGLGSERGIGQGADNGGLLENSGVHSFGQNDLDTSNAGLGNTHDEVVASMKKGAEAFSTETYQIKEQQQAWKRYQDELKAVNNVVNVFGGGLTRAFESALSGTQSFVSAMGQFLLQLIEKLIAAAAAAAVLDILLTATGFGGGASFSSIFGQLSGLGSVFGGTSKGSLGGGVVGGGISSAIGSHANGGIFTQPTLGIFGERGPEAIVTPEHLADFAGIQRGNNNSNDYPDYKIFGVFKGSDYQLMGVRSAKTKGRTQ